MQSQEIQQAAALQNTGRVSEALAIYRRLLKKQKRNADLLIRASLAALNLEEYDEAKSYGLRVLKLHPKAAVAHNVIGIVEKFSGRPNVALKRFDKAIALAPDDAQSRLNTAEILNELNRSSEAIHHLEEAIRLAPHMAMAHFMLGHALQARGDFPAAILKYREAISIEPHNGEFWKALAYANGTDLEKDMEPMRSAAKAQIGMPREKAKVLFAQFATLERAKAYERAFAALDEANTLYRSSFSYDVSNDEKFMAQLAKTFSHDLLERHAETFLSYEKDMGVPIFIVGMPRSGTTLVEQLIGNHPKVTQCGELRLLNSAVTKVRSHHDSANASTWKRQDVQRVGADYANGLHERDVQGEYFTDKMPHNFLYLGLIRMAFPKARIIHCRRNPIDVCLGIYRQILGGSHHYAYDQRTLVRYYHAYERLMAHWQRVMGGRILDVHYEDVVEQPEKEARRMLSFCELPWAQECLDLQANTNAVFTASSAQVRQGIHKRYLNRWKRYEPYIETIIQGLA